MYGDHLRPEHDSVTSFGLEIAAASDEAIVATSRIAKLESNPDPRSKIGSSDILDNSHFLNNKEKTREIAQNINSSSYLVVDTDDSHANVNELLLWRPLHLELVRLDSSN